MKKFALIAAGVVLLAAAGWSGLWFAGRGQVAERIDREISLLAEQGIEVDFGTREIGGFPFGYRITHRDVTVREPASGGVYHFPEITTEVTVTDIDRLVTRLPAKFRIDLPMPPTGRASSPEMPEVLVFDIEATDLVVVTDGLPGRGQEFGYTAHSLLVVTGGKGQQMKLAVEFTGIDSRATLPARASGLPSTSALTLQRLDYAYAMTTPDGVEAIFEGQIDKLTLTGRSDIRDRAGLMTLLSGGGGSMSMAYQTGASKVAIRAVRGPEQQGGTLIFKAGSTAGTFSFADNMVEIATSGRANTVTLIPEAAGKPADKLSFGAALRSVEAIYQAPIAPSEAMTPFTLRFALDEVVPDAALWARLDAAEALPRDPARLIVDIEGTGRISKSMADLRPGEALPLEFGNVLVRALDLSAMGASLTTRGEVEFLQPLNLPVGSITVTLTNIMELIRTLSEAGLLGPGISESAAALVAFYTEPGAAPGERVAEIAMTLDGIAINGTPIDTGR